MKSDKRKIGAQDLEAMMKEFLSKGGQVTQHPPGGSENVVYKNRFRGRPKAPKAPEGSGSE